MHFGEDEVTQAPDVDEQRLRSILKEHYGIKHATLSKLTGYEDCNFRLTDIEWEEQTESEERPTQVIVKVTNPMEARDSHVIDAQYLICAQLCAAGIPCPQPVRTRDGKEWQLHTVAENAILPVRIYRLLPGRNLEDFDFTKDLVNDIGRTLALVHSEFDKLELPPSALKHLPFISPENVLSFRREIAILEEKSLLSPEKRTLLLSTFDDLDSNIFAKRDEFDSGLIHSDFNETNILVAEDGKSITGVLDFGDMHNSLRVFDVAAAVLYLHLADRLQQDMPRLLAWVLEGYRSRRPFSSRDTSAILHAMRARLACSLIYGLRTARINFRGGSTDYVLKTQSNGWRELANLREMQNVID